MRKKLSVLLCAALALSLCACGVRAPALVASGGVPVSQGVYAWFLNDARVHGSALGLAPGDEAAAAYAETQCRRLVALDRYLSRQKIALRFDLKSEAAARTEGEWSLFRAHYRSLGMEKQDLTRVHTFEAQKKQLALTFYGPGGKEALSEQALRDSFVKLYVGFRAFEGALTTRTAEGESVPLDAKAQQALLEQFSRMAARANGGADLDELYAEYCGTQGLIVTAPLAVSLMKDGDPMYDDGFFAAVQALSPGSTGVVQTAGSVCLVQRVAIDKSDEDAFETYRDEVLWHEKLPDVEAFVATL